MQNVNQRRKVHREIEARKEEHLARVREVIAQPSISRENTGMRECANLLKGYFENLGCHEVEIAETPGIPAVWAYYDAGAPRTLAVYAYYDTNVVGEGWTYPPYDAVVAERPPFKKVVFGRGGGTKGGLLAFLNSLSAIRTIEGNLPVNLMFVVEGEEFLSSRNLNGLLERYRERLSKAECVLVPRPCQTEQGDVQLFLGSKASLNIELRCSGDDWGRGPIGGSVHGSAQCVVDSPVWRLVHALGTLYDAERNRVLVEGFYDGLQEPTKDDMALLDDLARRYHGREAHVIRGVGGPDRVPHFIDDLTGQDLFQRYCFQPTMNIYGLRAGYTGPGTALYTLPQAAYCSIQHALPKMDPEICLQKIREHLDRHGYGDIHIEVKGFVAANSLSLQDDLSQAKLRVLREWNIDPVVWPCQGASGPYGRFGKIVGLNVLTRSGIGYASDHTGIDEFLVVEGDGKVGGLVELEKSYADLVYSYATYPGPF